MAQRSSEGDDAIDAQLSRLDLFEQARREHVDMLVGLVQIRLHEQALARKVAISIVWVWTPGTEYSCIVIALSEMAFSLATVSSVRDFGFFESASGTSECGRLIIPRKTPHYPGA